MLFNAHEHDNNRHNGEDRCCKQVLPFDNIVAVEDVDTNSQGLQRIGGDQTQCNGVFVPCIDENEDQGGNDTGSSYGQQHADQCLYTVAAVNGCSLFHFGRNAEEGAAQQPNGKCLIECGIDEDQTESYWSDQRWT